MLSNFALPASPAGRDKEKIIEQNFAQFISLQFLKEDQGIKLVAKIHFLQWIDGLRFLVMGCATKCRFIFIEIPARGRFTLRKKGLSQKQCD